MGPEPSGVGHHPGAVPFFMFLILSINTCLYQADIVPSASHPSILFFLPFLIEDLPNLSHEEAEAQEVR